MRAKDIMTNAVITVERNARVNDAIGLMLEHNISALPVVDDDDRLIGLISEGDLMRRLRDKDAPRRSWWLEAISGSGNTAEDFIKTRSQHVSDVMTTDVESVSEDAGVGEIARLLEKRRIKRVPVLRDGRVVGIVSRANLLHALAQIGTADLRESTSTDEELREQVRAALANVPGASVNLINLTVEDGKVSLWGVADSDFVENALKIAAENVPGVRRVYVHMGRLPAWGYGI